MGFMPHDDDNQPHTRKRSVQDGQMFSQDSKTGQLTPKFESGLSPISIQKIPPLFPNQELNFLTLSVVI